MSKVRSAKGRSVPGTRPAKSAARPSARPLVLPFAFTAGLAAFAGFQNVRTNPILLASFAGACLALLVWVAILWTNANAARRVLLVEVSLRPQHYLQAIAHTSILVYWGLYWTPLRDAADLIAAQIVFAYAFDMLLAWSRRDTYTLGFGPFPIIYSTNLFLRFRDDWFYLQFLMIGVGFLAKELIRWEKDGRRTHVFNPSSFTLALFSLGLILTGTTDISWGEGIATQLIRPPQIYLFIFLVSLPGQFLFRVTTMTMPAVLTTYLFSVVYFRVTGTYYFFDSNVPIAVFLGMHLLFTDPSTAPRTELGRVVFGIMYGASVVGLYALLGWCGAPTFYDKLLQVPLLNLTIKALDRFARSPRVVWLDPERIGAALAPRVRSLAYVSTWIVLFGAMTRANGVGDHHPGHTVPFWENACRDGRRNACGNLAAIEARYCLDGSGWACNELAILGATGRARTKPQGELFDLSCRARFGAGCQNARIRTSGGTVFRHAEPSPLDYPVVLREGKGAIPEQTPMDVFARACEQGWSAGCGRLGNVFIQSSVVDKPRAAALWTRACDGGHAESCSNLGFMLKSGDGMPADAARARSLLKRACDLGMANACRWLAEQGSQR